MESIAEPPAETESPDVEIPMSEPPRAAELPVPPPGWVPSWQRPNARTSREPVNIAETLAALPVLADGPASDGVCRVCQQPFPARPALWLGKTILPTVCAACSEALDTGARDGMDAFRREVPPRYADTREDHPDLHPAFLAAATAWRDTGDGMGLGFTGVTGHGKTRCLTLALRWAAANGLSIAFCPACDLAKLAADQFEDDLRRRTAAQKRLHHLRTCRVLLLDDLGKERLTDRAASTLYDLIEHRAAHMLPVLWSANCDAAQLLTWLGEDRGPAVLRRLRDFTRATRLG